MYARAAQEIERAGGPVRRAPIPGVDPVSDFFKGADLMKGSGGGPGGAYVRGKVQGYIGKQKQKLAPGLFGKPAGQGAAQGAAQGMAQGAAQGAGKGAGMKNMLKGMKGMGKNMSAGGIIAAAIGRAMLGYLGAKYNKPVVHGAMQTAEQASAEGEGVLQEKLLELAKNQAKSEKPTKDPTPEEAPDKGFDKESTDDIDPQFWARIGSMFLGGL